MKIIIDRNGKRTKTDYSWQFGMGNDHAAQHLRTDMCEHIKLAHDELGIKYVRFHGIFDDDMLICQSLYDNRYMRGLPGAKNIGQFNFHQVGVVLDNVLNAGLKPFVELSFMPSALAKGKKIGFKYFHYENNVSLPKSFEKWQEFIRAFIGYITERYGKDEVESWYFEVWNEPDLGGFFAGSQKDYFRLYKATVEAVKSVNNNLRVGGPSTSACLWVDDFVNYCVQNNVKYDFVSTHHYPGDAFGNSFGIGKALGMMSTTKKAGKENWPLGKTYEALFFRPDEFKDWESGIFASMDEKAKAQAGEKPLFITEWNSMATFGSPVHDEKYSAAFVARAAIDLDHRCEGYMFWCISDLFEEQMLINEHFHGSFGIISNRGIPKPNFWAFKMLSMLYPERILTEKAEGDLQRALYTDDKNLQVLITAQNHDYYKNEKHTVELEIDFEPKEALAYRIDDEHCNPKKLWQDMGAKENLTKAEVERIKDETRLKAEKQSFTYKDGKCRILVELSTNDVILLDLKGE